MLPRTSPTKATTGVAFISAVHRSPAQGERPTAGSDEGNSSKDPLMTPDRLPVLTNP